jgi:hypothetical protein
LTKHHALQVALDGLQFAAVVVGHVGWRNACNLRHDVFNLSFANGLLALGRWQDALCSARLVNYVNGFVWQLTVVDELRRQLGCSLQRCIGIFDAVVFFKARLQALQNVHGLGHRRLDHIDLLEAT